MEEIRHLLADLRKLSLESESLRRQHKIGVNNEAIRRAVEANLLDFAARGSLLGGYIVRNELSRLGLGLGDSHEELVRCLKFVCSDWTASASKSPLYVRFARKHLMNVISRWNYKTSAIKK